MGRNQSATMVSFKEMLGMSRVGVQARAGRMTELPGDPPQRVAPRRILREASERCASDNAADVASNFGRGELALRATSQHRLEGTSVYAASGRLRARRAAAACAPPRGLGLLQFLVGKSGIGLLGQ